MSAIKIRCALPERIKEQKLNISPASLRQRFFYNDSSDIPITEQSKQ